jgi:hypothetical protein
MSQHKYIVIIRLVDTLDTYTWAMRIKGIL